MKNCDLVMGLPDIRLESDRQKVAQGSGMMLFVFRVMRAVVAAKIGGAIENSWNSWIWQARGFRILADTYRCHLVRTDFCMWGGGAEHHGRKGRAFSPTQARPHRASPPRLQMRSLQTHGQAAHRAPRDFARWSLLDRCCRALSSWLVHRPRAHGPQPHCRPRRRRLVADLQPVPALIAPPLISTAQTTSPLISTGQVSVGQPPEEMHSISLLFHLHPICGWLGGRRVLFR